MGETHETPVFREISPGRGILGRARAVAWGRDAQLVTGLASLNKEERGPRAVTCGHLQGGSEETSQEQT